MGRDDLARGRGTDRPDRRNQFAGEALREIAAVVRTWLVVLSSTDGEQYFPGGVVPRHRRLADTLMDRAILFELPRKLPHEQVERLRNADPGLFNDRAQDNWEPLPTCADVAGVPWPNRARKAALALSRTEPMTTGTQLLTDIRDVFEVRRVDRLTTSQLVAALCEDDGRK